MFLSHGVGEMVIHMGGGDSHIVEEMMIQVPKWRQHSMVVAVFVLFLTAEAYCKVIHADFVCVRESALAF